MDKIWLNKPYDISGKRIWVAGHNGMVGRALLRRFAQENCEVLTVEHSKLDLRRQSDVEEWVSANQPDAIIIAAAKVGGIGANAASPAEFFYDNIMIASNIMQSAYKIATDRLLLLGSSCIYPKDAKQPIREAALLSGALESTNEAYALAKIAALKMAGYYRVQYGCDFISAMPCNLYGVGDTYNLQNSHVIPALIMKAHLAKINSDDDLSIWGSGTPLREFLYVDDLADILVFLLQNYSSSEHINVGSGEEVSIAKLTKEICNIVGFKGELMFDNSKPDGTLRKLLDNSKLLGVGWKPEICLKDGILKCYEDFLNR